MEHRLTKAGRLDGRIFNGGRRKGAGRPISPERKMAEDFAFEYVIVKERRHGQVRRVKKMRVIVVLDALFKIAMYGKGRKSLRAINIWLNYAVGKPERAPEDVARSRQRQYLNRMGWSSSSPRNPRNIVPSRKQIDERHADELLDSIYGAHDAISKGDYFPKPKTSQEPDAYAA